MEPLLCAFSRLSYCQLSPARYKYHANCQQQAFLAWEPICSSGWYDSKTMSFFFSNQKLKNVSCEYDRWVVETQLCKLRDTSDTLIGRACAMFQLKYGVCELDYIYDMVVDTQIHKFYGRPFARVLYLFLMKDIGRSLPWVLPGSILQGRCCP